MRILTCIFLGLLALLLPLVIRSNYWLYMFTLVGIYIILVASLDLIYGYTGLVSLGHAAFFGIGAYACGILQTKLGFSFLPALILGSLFTCSVAAVLGWPMLRIKGPYFALGTLALGLMVTIVIHNWDSLTGGVSLSGIPLPPSIQLLDWTIDFSSKRTYYYFVFLFVFLALFFIRQITRSRPGRAFQSIRENADLAEALGVETLRYKLIAYVMASTMAGVAGGLYASYMGSIEPEIAGGPHVLPSPGHDRDRRSADDYRGDRGPLAPLVPSRISGGGAGLSALVFRLYPAGGDHFHAHGDCG